MRATLTLDGQDLATFKGQVEATISNVGKGTKKATTAAAEEILELSLAQVPKQTGTLAASAGYVVEGSSKEGFSATVGYGIQNDPINPKTGKPASAYALAVHEDLSVVHPNGKAKYLEDAVNEYASENFPRTVMQYVGNAINGGAVDE